MKYLIKLFILCYCSALFASSISIDVGQTKALYNRFVIPNTLQDRVSLPVDDELTSYRLTGYYDLASGNQLYFLIAPLSTSYSFIADRDFEFATRNFSAGTSTDVNYKFNSYRFGSLWK